MKRMLGFRKISLLSAYLAIFAVILLVSSDTLPALSQDPSGPVTIESDAANVGQSGIWTSQNAAEASGGSYLYSNGNEDDVLTLDFYGSTIEITYVSHPTFGTFAIEVDNTILRTVSATSEATTFGQVAVIDYLDNEPHTLRVFSVDGVVAIDAFTTQLPPPVVSAPTEFGAPEAITCEPDTFPIRASIRDNDFDTISPSTAPSLSGDGRYVAFASTDNQLVLGDTNAVSDIFVYDRLLCIMERVSVTSAGTQATGGASLNPSISQYGRYVAFESNATNLVANDVNGVSDIFVHDRQTGITTRVSVSTGGTPGDGHSTNPDISADGQKVVFQSSATNLNGGGAGTTDIFVRDIGAGTTTIVSVSTGGTPGDGNSTNPVISGNGQIVAYQSTSRNLVASDAFPNIEIFLRDLNANSTSRVTFFDGGELDGDSRLPDISYNGQYIAFETDSEDIVVSPPDTNEAFDIYVHDRLAVPVTNTRVSLTAANGESNDDSNSASISGNGKYVAFYSGFNFDPADTGGTDVYVKDLASGAIQRASLLNNGSEPTIGEITSVAPSLSDSGRNVALESRADLTDDTSDQNSVEDIYVADIPFNLAPSDMIATAIADDEINLHWNDNTGDETGFDVQRSLNGTSGWVSVGPAAADARDWISVNLNCETTYYFRVAAIRSGGNTDYSNIASARTLLCAMSPPSNLTITAVGFNNLDMTWTDESSTETEFRIYRSEVDIPPPFDDQVGTVESNVDTFQDTNVNCPVTYYYYVTAYRAVDDSETEASNVVSVTTPTCPDPGVTTLLSPLNNTAIGTPTFRFTEAYLTDAYQLTVKNDLGVTVIFGTYEAYKPGGAQCSGGECWISPGRSLPDGDYTWSILTYYHPSFGDTSYDQRATAFVDFSIVPPQPVSPINITVNSFVDNVFTWDEIPGITYYYLEIKTNSWLTIHSEWYEAPNCVALLCSVTVPDRLPGNGTYWWRIRVWNSLGYGPYSPWVSFTVNVAAPGMPQDLDVPTDATGMPTAFEWTKDGNISWYNLYVQGPGGIWINKWSKADTICSGSTCSFPTTLPFVDGSYLWWVGAYSPVGVTAWSQPSGTSLVVNLADPAVPTNFGFVANPVNSPPTELSWDDDEHTTWYHVTINDEFFNVWHNKWYEKGNSALSCVANTCTLPLNIAFTDRDYNWWVQAYGPGGTSAWSAEQNFDVALGKPGPPGGLDETLNANDVPIELLWVPDAKATWYHVIIQDQYNETWLNAWYEKNKSALTCSGLCQLPINIDFLDRDYKWWVQAYGPGGTSAWSSPQRDFTVDVGAPDEPSGRQTTVGLQSINFQWNDDPNATWFNLYVIDPNSNPWINTWYEKGNSALQCNGTTCNITIDMPFWEVTYYWKVQAYGPGGGTWTQTYADVTVTYLDGGQPDGLAETIDFTSGMPSSLSWNYDTNTTWYQVYLYSSAGIWLNKWYEASTICTVPTCTISVDTLPFVAGAYTWYVNGYAPGGGGGWSGKDTFTISAVSLAAPVLQSPADDAFFATENVTFQWEAVGQANWYELEIKGSNNQVYTTLNFLPSACNAGICTGSGILSSDLLLNGTWRVRGRRNAGTVKGSWSVSRTISVLN